MANLSEYGRHFGYAESIFGSDTKGHDLKAYGATTGKYIFWDASADTLYITGTVTVTGSVNSGNMALIDAETLTFGTGLDVVMNFDGTSMIVAATTDDLLIEVGDSAATQKSFDVKWYANEASGASYVYFDAGGNFIYTTGVDLQFKDSDILIFGTGAGQAGDIGITYDANSLNITPIAVSDVLELGSTGHTMQLVMSGSINFETADLVFDDDDAFINIGTWNSAIAIAAQTDHFVPIQVNLASGTSVAKDIAAARLRVDTHATTANTLTALNVLELRSKIHVDVGSHANLQCSTEITENKSCTGDFLVGYFSLQGDGNITCSNHVNVMEVTNTHTGSGVDQVAHFTHNSTSTITNIAKLQCVTTGTITSMLDITNTGGTVTNAIKVSGTHTYDISLQNAETIDNAVNGTVQVTASVLKLAFDAAAYMTITQADAGAVTFDSVSDGTAGFAFSDPITGNNTVTTAALGTVRAIVGNVTASGTDISGGLITGVRGHSTASGTITAGGAYVIGTQGKLTVTGTMNHEDSRLAALFGQLDISAGTYTNGQMSCLWVDAGASASVSAASTGGGGQFNMLRVTNTTTANANAIMYAYAAADFFLQFGSPLDADWFAVNTTSIDSRALSYVLLVKDAANGTGYIPVYASVPS